MTGSNAPPRVVDADACERAVSEPELIEEIANGFIAYSGGNVIVPPVGHLALTEPEGDVHIKYGYVRGGEVFVVKVAAGVPANAALGLPTGDGCMLVFSRGTALLLAVLLDRARLTDIRTAAAGAVAARALASRTLSCIGVIGSGVQARLQA
ncbi:MAG: ornithine cyclodeaminase family protein, partial [Gemmatimonadales bacterium]